MTTPDPKLVAIISAKANARIAHHEAGHAVAAVARGGFLDRVHLGYADWSTSDESGDEPGETHHWTTPINQPFVTFAGPWATAMWMVEHDPGVDEFEEALGYAWDDAADGDSVKYEDRVEALTDAAAQMGFPVVGRSWEYRWADELDPLWPAVCDVAAQLLDEDAEPVTHDDVAAAIERAEPSRPDD